MASLTGKRRLVLAAAYAGSLVFAVGALVVVQMAYNRQVHAAIYVPVLLFHTLPILVVKFFQDLAFGGPDGGGGGYAALVYFGAVLLQWWPLPAVAAVPRLWTSRVGSSRFPRISEVFFPWAPLFGATREPRQRLDGRLFTCHRPTHGL